MYSHISFLLMLGLVLECVIPVVPSGEPCSVQCDWLSWNTWSNCTESCGGGHRVRYRSLCCPTYLGSWHACVDFCGHQSSDGQEDGYCNEFCENGGTHTRLHGCSCSYGYIGGCCQTGV